MFPTSSLPGSALIPGAATFWMPKPRDIDEEGISFFRGTWLIKDVTVSESRRLAIEERNDADFVGNLAATSEDFDRLAHAAEDGFDGYALSAHERAALDSFVSDDEGAALGSLELGVAGLVYALATVRIIPASDSAHGSDNMLIRPSMAVRHCLRPIEVWLATWRDGPR